MQISTFIRSNYWITLVLDCSDHSLYFHINFNMFFLLNEQLNNENRVIISLTICKAYPCILLT